ncbi:hypothetical protein PRIPAC_89467 [Pristionchus pacificus]|nr:hypothetical protein PRIPAC_89467 [Pristionchus pacificus]
MDDGFFDDDVQFIPPQPVEIEDGEIENIEGGGNPMEKLESQSIRKQVDNLLWRLFAEAPVDGRENEWDGQAEEMEVEMDERGGADSEKLLNASFVHVVKKIECDKGGFTHEVVVPTGRPVPELRARNAVPSHQFEFVPDPFQDAAFQVVENEQTLLVAAHTSAGKTAIAQYAIAEALRNQKCVIYTSPIKALSNQKYRELEEHFDAAHIGLMTGDVTLNPSASIQVMTTEILRSMLYRKSEFFSQVAWVIFDEVHYMNNEDRGVVWEESIILLPPHIRQLFLSATIPNASQFAGWICSLKKAPIHVITTDRRPVPIVHYVLPVGSERMFEIITKTGYYRLQEHEKAIRAMEDGLKSERERRERKKTIKEQWIVHTTRTLRERLLMPCIAFTFSRTECEHYAAAIREMDMTDDTEKQTVRGIVENAMDRLTDEDRKLSQFQNLLPLLVRGIAIHHSGLLPVVKETVELLFAHSLVKMLFATETFAMGLNIPARSVLFTSARKFDGKRNRWLSASEYAQMSGRAGRRDSTFPVGVSVLMLDEQIKGNELRGIVQGSLDPLTSRFHLSYNMLLNLLATGEITPEQMMELSFRKYQNTMEVPELSKVIAAKESALSTMTSAANSQMTARIESYLELENGIKRIHKTTKKMYMTVTHMAMFFNTGRLLKIKFGELDFGWGVLMRFERKTIPNTNGDMTYILEVLINVDAASAREFNSTGLLRPATRDGKSSWEVVPMTVNCVDEISTVRFRVYKEMKRSDMRDKLGRLVEGFVHNRMAGAPTLLDPIRDMRVNNPALEDALLKLRKFEKTLAEHPLDTMRRGTREEKEHLDEMRKEFEERTNAELELKQMRKELRKKKEDIRTGTELFRRKELLLKLGYIDDNNELKAKGRIAACISTGDELLLTELLVSGELEKVSNGEIAAILSCFVCDEASGTRVSRDLDQHHKMIQRFARKIAGMINKTGQELVEGEYVDGFKSSMMEVTRQWVKSVGFGTLMKSTDLYEGTIIRCLRRLEELLKEMSAAADVIDNKKLKGTFDDIRSAIRRDIVFASSLYL